jgi:hypothetical protein
MRGNVLVDLRNAYSQALADEAGFVSNIGVSGLQRAVSCIGP